MAVAMIHIGNPARLRTGSWRGAIGFPRVLIALTLVAAFSSESCVAAVRRVEIRKSTSEIVSAAKLHPERAPIYLLSCLALFSRD